MPITPEFLLTSLVVVLIPGTGVIYTVSNGLFISWRAACAAALGCTFGIVPHLLASVFGLSAILHLSSLAFQCIKYAGAVYLLYLAWAMWKETGSINFNKPERVGSLFQIAVRGTLINILNPKLSIFFLAFLPLFIPAEAPNPMPQMLLLSAIFMLMTFVVFVIYGFCANGLRKYVTGSDRLMTIIQKSFAATFAALGIKLAVTDR